MPVIILTGHGCETAAAEGQKYGAADYISKPYAFEDLIQKIYSTLRAMKNEDIEFQCVARG